MPATPADIAAASRDVELATWSDGTIAGRYPSARDGSVTPATGYFDSAADAQTVINARGALIGSSEPQRFSVEVQDLLWPSPETGFPTDRLIDAEQVIDASFITARIELDLDAETTTHELFG
jgi:hypothetical protein